MRAGSPTIRISTRLDAWPVPPCTPPRGEAREFCLRVSGHHTARRRRRALSMDAMCILAAAALFRSSASAS
jgi:hypothetical protein